MSSVPALVEKEIATLSPDVHAGFREALQAALRTLSNDHNLSGAVGAILMISSALDAPDGFMAHIAEPGKLTKTLFIDRIEQLKQIANVPSEIYSDLHWIRVRSNTARHGTTADYSLSVEDGVGCLERGLAIARWFYTKRRSDLRWVSPGAAFTGAGGKDGPKVWVKLPVTGEALFGRDRELATLDESWGGELPNVLSIIGPGGLGKSSLLNHWLGRMASESYRRAEFVFGWSFYTFGTDTTDPDTDSFFRQALEFFSGPSEVPGTPDARGELLAELVRRRRVLLILDGLEPLQHAPNTARAGEIKDPAVAALLRQLAHYNLGLCLVSSRYRIADLAPFEKSQVKRIDLESLSPAAGAELLRSFGVGHPNPEEQARELELASREYDGHALSLTLLATFLRNRWHGDIRRRDRVQLFDQDEKHFRGHAFRVLRSYLRWFQQEGREDEVWLLRLLGFFDRPIESRTARLLLSPSLTTGAWLSIRSALIKLLRRIGLGFSGSDQKALGLLADPDRWRTAIENLRDARLVAKAGPSNPEVLDTHPYIREFFTKELQSQLGAFWRDGNRLLFEHCRGVVPNLPETTDQMGWLYQAVAHGCRAGRHTEACAIYKERIMRGDLSFSTRKLGLYAADLAGLAHFFDQPWVSPSGRLGPVDAAYLVRTAGFRLRGLARLDEAAEALRRAFLSYKAAKNALESSRVGRNLCETLTLMGDLPGALEVGNESVSFADACGDRHQMIAERAAVAVTYHYLGKPGEAEALFRRSEELQAKLTPQHPKLFALRGYHYSVFLLDQGKYAEVVGRGEETILWLQRKEVEGYGPVDLPLEHLALGLAKLHGGAGHGSRQERITAAKPHLEEALAGLRRAGRNDFLPLGLLARSQFLREVAEEAASAEERAAQFGRAEEYLDEVEQICTKVQMSIYLLDCHLERAQVRLARTDGVESARGSLHEARKILTSCPYFRRSAHLDELERQAQGGALAALPSQVQ